MSSNNVWALAFTALFANACAAQTFTCPEQIQTPATLLGDYPGWKAFASSQHQYFDRISISSGSPDQEAMLAPDIDTKKLVGWNVSADEELWMVCNYLSSNVRLAQRLPAGIKQCSVRFKPVGTKAAQQSNELTCK